MPVSTHPADDEARSRDDITVTEAVQNMVPGAHDLEIARYLLADESDQLILLHHAREELRTVRTLSVDGQHRSHAEMMRRHADRVEED
jgi:hypothetical protein